ncbi:hypothetical protein B0H11DRAFT_2260138 [Mycena galericulata]|nr:hypothetical protein B0H11DRAFT_2260138 [Mycena galericulata]
MSDPSSQRGLVWFATPPYWPAFIPSLPSLLEFLASSDTLPIPLYRAQLGLHFLNPRVPNWSFDQTIYRTADGEAPFTTFLFGRVKTAARFENAQCVFTLDGGPPDATSAREVFGAQLNALSVPVGQDDDRNLSDRVKINHVRTWSDTDRVTRSGGTSITVHLARARGFRCTVYSPVVPEYRFHSDVAELDVEIPQRCSEYIFEVGDWVLCSATLHRRESYIEGCRDYEILARHLRVLPSDAFALQNAFLPSPPLLPPPPHALLSGGSRASTRDLSSSARVRPHTRSQARKRELPPASEAEESAAVNTPPKKKRQAQPPRDVGPTIPPTPPPTPSRPRRLTARMSTGGRPPKSQRPSRHPSARHAPTTLPRMMHNSADLTLALPVELIAECLSWAVAPTVRKLLDLLHIRFVLSHVCSRWRRIIQSDSRNWHTIHLYRYLKPSFIDFSILQAKAGSIDLLIDTIACKQPTNGYGSRRVLKYSTPAEFLSSVIPKLALVFVRVRTLRIVSFDETELKEISRSLEVHDGTHLQQVEFHAHAMQRDNSSVINSSLFCKWRSVSRLGLHYVSPLFLGVHMYANISHLALASMWGDHRIAWPELRPALDATVRLRSLRLHEFECSSTSVLPAVRLPHLKEFSIVFSNAPDVAADVTALFIMPAIQTFQVAAWSQMSIIPLIQRCGDLFGRATHVAVSFTSDAVTELSSLLPALIACTHLDLRGSTMESMDAFSDVNPLPALRLLQVPIQPSEEVIADFLVAHAVHDDEQAFILTTRAAPGSAALYSEWKLVQGTAVCRDFLEDTAVPELNDPYLYT